MKFVPTKCSQGWCLINSKWSSFSPLLSDRFEVLNLILYLEPHMFKDSVMKKHLAIIYNDNFTVSLDKSEKTYEKKSIKLKILILALAMGQKWMLVCQ